MRLPFMAAPSHCSRAVHIYRTYCPPSLTVRCCWPSTPRPPVLLLPQRFRSKPSSRQRLRWLRQLAAHDSALSCFLACQWVESACVSATLTVIKIDKSHNFNQCTHPRLVRGDPRSHRRLPHPLLHAHYCSETQGDDTLLSPAVPHDDRPNRPFPQASRIAAAHTTTVRTLPDMTKNNAQQH